MQRIIITPDALPLLVNITGLEGDPAVEVAATASQIADSSPFTSHRFNYPDQDSAERVSFTDLDTGLPVKVHSVLAQATVRANATHAEMFMRLGDSTVIDTGDGFDLFNNNFVPNVVQGFTSPRFYRDWDDAEWTLASVNGLFTYWALKTLEVEEMNVQLFDHTLSIYVIYQPVIGITAPINGAMGVSLRPLIRWNYTGNGEAQYQYNVKIFDKDVAEDSLFDVESDPTVYDSGVITSSAVRHQVENAILTAGTDYYVYLKVWKNMNVDGATEFPLYASEWTWAKFHTNEAPVVNVVAPTGTITTTRRPVTNWTYSDDEGQPALTHEVKVWTYLQYVDETFSPTISPAFREFTTTDPDVISGNFGWKIDPAIPNGDYYVGVRAAQSPDGVWSEWDIQAFTVDTSFETSDPPTLTATPDPDNGRVILSVTRSLDGVAPEHFSITREVDGVVSNVRGAEYETPADYSGWAAHVVYDHEAPFNKIITYSAVLWNDTIDDPEPSLPTEFSTILQTKVVWLKDPLDSSKNSHFYVEGEWIDRARAKPRTVRRPLGRTLPVVTRGKAIDESFAVPFLVLGPDQYAKMMALVDSDRTLLIQTARTSWYVDIVAVNISEYLWSDLRGEDERTAWRFTLGMQEIEAP